MRDPGLRQVGAQLAQHGDEACGFAQPVGRDFIQCFQAARLAEDARQSFLKRPLGKPGFALITASRKG